MPEKTRTTHVWRAKNPANEEIWIDLERVDKIVSHEEGQGGLYRKTTRKMFWADEAGDQSQEVPHPTRTTTELRVENPQDEAVFVPVRVIDKQVTQRGHGIDYKKTTKKFVNDKEINTVREFTVRRVHHWDTATDPSEDGGLDYVRIEGTRDETQYVDVAVIEKVIQTRGQGPSYKKRTYKFNTDPIKEFSEAAPDDVDMSKVVWLDPWQNIVNVKWATDYISMQFNFHIGHLPGDGVIANFPNSVVGSVPYFPSVEGVHPANDTYSVSQVRSAFWRFEALDNANFEFSAHWPPEREDVSGGVNFAGGGRHTYLAPFSSGPFIFMTRHFHTPGSPLTGPDASQVRVPPYTDNLAVTFEIYSDVVVDGPYSVYRVEDLIPVGTMAPTLYITTTGMDNIYATTTVDFTGATAIFTDPETNEEKTYRAVGGSLLDREPMELDRNNGPFYVLFKRDPDA